MIASGENDDLGNLSRQARYERRKSQERADIGEIPAVVNPERRKRCLESLQCWLTEYFPNSTGMTEFCPEQKEAVEAMQESAISGGNHVNAYPRGFAKTTTTQNTALWVTFRGLRRFLPIFSANDPQAEDLLTGIKFEIENNELLYEDFPEICFPIRCLEGKPQRCKSQVHNGKPTNIVWKAGKIVFPTIEGSAASGAIIMSKSLTGSATRGLVHKRPDGTNQRPDWVIVDDPQTNDSAANIGQVRKRMDILKRSILRSGGHRAKQLSCVCNGTVICQNDFMEILLDQKQSPNWSGRRIKMVKKFADNHETFWLGEYARIRHAWDRNIPNDRQRAAKEATDYYAANRERGDAGCEVTWENCYNPEAEVSAIQHAYNILVDEGPDIFATECQNEPRKEEHDAAEQLKPAELRKKLNGFARFEFPRECEYIESFIDVQGSMLWHATVAFAPDFTGYVIDYGAYPDQNKRYYTLKDAQNTFERVFPGQPLETQIFAALTELVNKICDRTYRRADGTELHHGHCIIDANWGVSTRTVKRVCQTSKHRAKLIPWHGKAIGPAETPMSLWRHQPGEKVGVNWVIKPDKEATSLRYIVPDVNYWKSFLANRLRLQHPAKQSLSFWGDDQLEHEMLADHCCSEYSEKTEGKGRTVNVWKQKPNNPDNHLWDCLVGCCVAASVQGATLESQATKQTKREYLSIPAHLRR